ncbi:Pam17-domain-containing protein [Patellaria atrata CBS 101060]|uniref:Presequence translocated-associated motor subunit PAM17 n=1 Tax=Patellaria atrata CBS 101060 TaxID=1346257 RepID=A0A9P4SH35_9PEZI|nr:Pam17-domain-containing protein [Patellaria atrata CBS 101060]
MPMRCTAILPFRTSTSTVASRFQSLSTSSMRSFTAATASSRISNATSPRVRSSTASLANPTIRPSPELFRVPKTPPQSRTLTTTAPPPSSSAANASSTLTWNRFLALRRTRRRISLFASVIAALGTTAAGAVFISTRDLDAVGSQVLGLDQVIVLGLGTIASGALGWLVGPFIGGAVFGMVFRGVRGEMGVKEREFFARIKKYRVDPSSSSIANPVPDYYGEKIGSVADYRRWLKDQRAFNLKRAPSGASKRG